MIPPEMPATDTLSPHDLKRVIAVCDRFEADWNAGRPCRIETELAAADDAIRPHLFRELLALELELTRRSGGAADQDVYLRWFPDCADIVRAVFAGPDETVTYPDAAGAPRDVEATPLPGGYELLRPLGRGGQATTYLARDHALKRLVVLKRYHGVDSTDRREAVLNEGRALVRLRSPYVARCHEVETRDGAIDLIVEYVPGRPLTELTAEERADTARCTRLVEQVAEGLAEVHACGLLHRDIKPQNILLGDDGMPRLVDFGLAVPLNSEALQAVAGSPPYMAPEQARGQGERIDARTDVYGLGAVLYFLLTGQPPHDGKTFDAILENARTAPILAPRRINRRAPRALERVCLRALAPDPQSRYASADALAHALRRYRRTRRAAPVLGAVALLITLLVPAWTSWYRLRPRRLPPERPGRAIAGAGSTAPQPRSEPAASDGLRVARFEITHFAKLDENHDAPNRTGLLGRRSFGTREDDQVAVRAELSTPAYAYLIAFRPDGCDELCDPDDEDTPPPRKQEPMYPPPAKTDERYGLNEGPGLHAFAVVVSRTALPPYREWKRRHGPPPWAAKQSCEPGVVWRDDGHGLQPLLANDPSGIRGKGVKARGSGGAAAALARWLRGLPGVDAVTLEAFPVLPTAKP